MDKLCRKAECSIKDFFKDLIFPNRCPFCREFISYELTCCPECLNKVLWADENICPKCGKSIVKGCMCGENIRYDQCVCAAYYAENARMAIYSLKYRCSRNSAEIFGRILRERLNILQLTDKIDICIPVPMSARSLRQRGYNQAERVAKNIISNSRIKLETDHLYRKNVRIAQHKLNAEQRKSAVTDQYFAAKNVDLTGKTVLLVDDVITTCSTLSYCAGLIKDELHAEKVICAVCTTV